MGGVSLRPFLPAFALGFGQHRVELSSQPAEEALWRLAALVTLRFVRHLAIKLMAVGTHGYKIDVHY